MSGFSVRPAAAFDAESITSIYADAVRHGTASFELELPNATEMARRRQSLVDAGYPYLVAVDHTAPGRVLGYAYAAAFHSRPAYRHTVEDSIYVAAAAQRRGVGRLLLETLIIRAAELGFRQMIAVIGDPSRQAASIGLHAAAGFRRVGTFNAVGYKHGRWLDCVSMQRPLGVGEAQPPGGRP